MIKSMKYRWVPDVPDFRDKYHVATNEITSLPPTIDLSDKMTPVENQGDLGACTGHAITSAVEFLEFGKSKRVKQLSRLYVYYNERWIEGSIKEDAGAIIRDGIKSLVKWGACDESLWAYDPEKFQIKPPVDAYHDGEYRKIKTYYRVDQTLKDLLNALADGFPIIMGFTVYESFEGDDVSVTGLVPMPKLEEKQLGGHAVLCVGYDIEAKTFKVRNSWGEEWGDHGYFYMPFDYLTNGDLAEDFWIVEN